MKSCTFPCACIRFPVLELVSSTPFDPRIFIILLRLTPFFEVRSSEMFSYPLRFSRHVPELSSAVFPSSMTNSINLTIASHRSFRRTFGKLHDYRRLTPAFAQFSSSKSSFSSARPRECKFLISNCHDVYRNLALEDWLYNNEDFSSLGLKMECAGIFRKMIDFILTNPLLVL